VARPIAAPRDAEILTKALIRGAAALGVNQRRLAAILGVSEATVSRLGRGKSIEAEDKHGELALLFLRLFRSLDTLVGGDETKARDWLWSENRDIGGIPAERIVTIAGLVDVVAYLDALRGKL
jgi:hypothetical protein